MQEGEGEEEEKERPEGAAGISYFVLNVPLLCPSIVCYVSRVILGEVRLMILCIFSTLYLCS